MIDLVRLFAGPRWYPQTIRCRAPHAPTKCQEHLPNTLLHGGAQALTIPIPRRFLHLPPLRGRVTRAVSGSRIDCPEDLPAALREVMKGHLRGGRARLELAAEIVGTSPRSLQRQLKECDTTFARVLEQARCQVSAEQLADPEAQVIDVANAAGYSDPSNFSRWREMASAACRGALDLVCWKSVAGISRR